MVVVLEVGGTARQLFLSHEVISKITLKQLIFQESCSLSSLAFSDFVLETAKDENPSTSKSEEHGDAETPKR